MAPTTTETKTNIGTKVAVGISILTATGIIAAGLALQLDSPTPPSATPTACADSDGGLEYYTKGTTKGAWIGDITGKIDEKTDVCYSVAGDSNQYLAEYSCDHSVQDPTVNGIAQHAFICPNGCKDGACIQKCDASNCQVGYKASAPVPLSGAGDACKALVSPGKVYSSVFALIGAATNSENAISSGTDVIASNLPEPARYWVANVKPNNFISDRWFHETNFDPNRGIALAKGEFTMQSSNITLSDHFLNRPKDNSYGAVCKVCSCDQAVVTPSVAVTSPRGGETWRVGETYEVTWNASNIEYVKLYIYDIKIGGLGGTDYITPDNISIPAAVGSYSWKIGIPHRVLPGANYKIRVDAVDKDGNMLVDSSGKEIRAFSDNVFSVIGSGWEEVGNPFGNIYSSASMDINPSTGEPYVIWGDAAVKATVKKYDGTSWVNVGNPGFSDGTVSSSDIAFSSLSKTPYVAFSDFGLKKGRVMKFNGSSWESVGSGIFDAESFSTAHPNYIKIEFSSKSDDPYVIFNEPYSLKASVKKFNGSSWEYVGSGSFSPGNAKNPSLAFYPESDVPYVSFGNSANGGKITVMRLNGSSWEYRGLNGFSKGEILNGSGNGLAFNPENNELYVAYIDNINSDNSGMVVKKFNGSDWINVGSFTLNAGNYNNPSIAFGLKDRLPYVSYSNSAVAEVKKFDGSVWQKVGSSDLNLGNPIIRFNSFNSGLYLLGTSNISNEMIRVLRFPF